MAAYVDEVAEKIRQAVLIILSGASDSTARREAHNVIDSIKESKLDCAPVGFRLFRSNQEATVRLAGLQLVEHSIRLNWNDLPLSEHQNFQSKAMQMLLEAQYDEPSFVKEGLSKVIVEIIKRTWPQHWPNLFQDLGNVAQSKIAQLELVLLVLLRLSEDLNGLDASLESKTNRRRDMMTSLNKNMVELFKFFVDTLRTSTAAFRDKGESNMLHIAKAALLTIASFVTWSSADVLFQDANILLQALFLLLPMKELRLHSITCLCAMLERKFQQIDQRMKFMVLLSSDALSIIKDVARDAETGAINNEDDYVFLKKLAQACADFGCFQLAPCWGDDRGFSCSPENFGAYLQLMLNFANHDSMIVSYTSVQVFHSLVLHPCSARDEIFLSFVVPLLDVLLCKMAKLCDPRLESNPKSVINRQDFPDLVSYQDYFGQLRCHVMDIMRKITRVHPRIAMKHLRQKICDIVESPLSLDMKEHPSRQEFQLGSIMWEALGNYSNHHCCAVFFREVTELTQEDAHICNDILQRLLEYQSEVPSILVALVSCLEGFYPFFRHSPNFLVPVIQKVLYLVNTRNDDKECLKLRRAVCASFVKMCEDVPDILANSLFCDLQRFVAEQFSRGLLSNHEKYNLMQGLLSVSMHLAEKGVQREFILATLAPVQEFFALESIRQMLSTVDGFINYLGLGKSLVVASDEAASRRSNLVMLLYTVDAVVQSCCISTEDEVNDNPGSSFFGDVASIQFPWLQPMCALLSRVLEVANNFYLLWALPEQLSADVLPALGAPNPGAHQAIASNSDVEKTQPEDASQGSNKIKFGMRVVHDLSLSILGHSGLSLGSTLFASDGLACILRENILKHFPNAPLISLQKAWKLFIKPFILACPRTYFGSFIGPFLKDAIGLTFHRLRDEWQSLNEAAREAPKIERKTSESDEDEETKEVTQQALVCGVTREFVDVLAVFMAYKRSAEKSKEKQVDGSLEILGKLGHSLLECNETNQIILVSLFTILGWPDTTNVNKLHRLLMSVITKVFPPDLRVNEEIPCQLLLCLLTSYATHASDVTGQGNLIALVTYFYCHLRMQYPGLVHVMMRLPSCTEADLKKFDLECFASETPMSDLSKRKRMKAFLESARQPSVSQLYRNPVELKDLPTLAPVTKPKTYSLIDDASPAEASTALCALFTPDS